MTDEIPTTQNSPDGAQNTAGQPDNQSIPYSRFKEVNDQKRAFERELETLRKEKLEREEADRLARGEHQKIIDELKPEAEQAKKLRQAMEEIFTLELQGVPEDMRDLIPGGDVSTRLTWLKNAKTRGLFKKPDPPITDAGAQGNPAASTARLTDEERQLARLAGMTDEQYAKFKAHS